jgi:hypothetical protein
VRSRGEDQRDHELEHIQLPLTFLNIVRLHKLADRLRVQSLPKMLSQFVARHRRLRLAAVLSTIVEV